MLRQRRGHLYRNGDRQGGWGELPVCGRQYWSRFGVRDKNFKDVTFTTVAGKFTDPNALPGFNPFNIHRINGNLYVTYAKVNSMGVGQPGGFVDEYDTSGNFIKRIATMGGLYAPWGITLAPGRFGQFSDELLIGQFGDGQILAYDPTTDAFLGTLMAETASPLIIRFFGH
jgi:uncharacterized protein (TIGR03118 family)